MRSFTPAAWAWALPDGRVFLAATGAVVAAADPAVAAWSEPDGWAPTPCPPGATGTASLAALQAELALHGLSLPASVLPAPTAAELIAHANARQWALATGGFTATIRGAAVAFATDEGALGLMDGKVMRLAQPNAPATVNWQVGPTSFVSIPADDFVCAAILVGDFVQATFDALPAVFAAIRAGTIATTAQVDAAAWPAPAGAVA